MKICPQVNNLDMDENGQGPSDTPMENEFYNSSDIPDVMGKVSPCKVLYINNSHFFKHRYM